MFLDEYKRSCFHFFKAVIFEFLEECFIPKLYRNLEALKAPHFKRKALVATYIFVLHMLGKLGRHCSIETSLWKNF